MDFYISSLAGRIPCTRLHRQVQDPRGRQIAAFAVSSDGKLAALATYPREHRSVERSVNVLFKDGKALRNSNYHKAVQRQRRLTEQHNELEFNVEQYIRHSLQMDALGAIVEEVALSTPSLRGVIKNNNTAPPPEPRPLVPCAVVIYDTMYFNPVEEFIYGYKMNDAVYLQVPAAKAAAAAAAGNGAVLPPNVAASLAHKCLFKPNQVHFGCDDSLLVLASAEDGAKVFSMDTEYVELLCHFRPQLRDDLALETFKVLSCVVVMADLHEPGPELPPPFTSTRVFCAACKQAVVKDAEVCKNEALPYTVVLECIVCLTSHPPLRMTIHSRWPSGEAYVADLRHVHPTMQHPIGIAEFIVATFKAAITYTREFATLEHIHTYWTMEPYMHDHTEFLIHSEKPVKSGYTKTLLNTQVDSKDYLAYTPMVAIYSPDARIHVMDMDCNVLGYTEVPESEEGYFTIDVNRNGSMLALIGAESIILYRLLITRNARGTIDVELEHHMQFPQVVGVGRREEVIAACFGRDLSNRWLYVSVARGSVDAVMYIVDIAPGKGKDAIKRTLNMNSVIFPCVTDMIALESSVIVMPRHQRFLVQLTQEHMDNTDDAYSRQFCHFPVLATNKEALMLNGELHDGYAPEPSKFDLLTFERQRQIEQLTKRNGRLNVSRWLDALYQYNALCMYKGRPVAVGSDPHDYLLPPLRRVRQQFPFGYDAKQFYDPLLSVEFTGSPALMRAQCYEWVREVIARTGFANPMYPLEVVYDEKLHMLDFVCAKICISQWDNPSDIVFSMRTNDFLRLQLCNFLKISQRLDRHCDQQGLVPFDKTAIYKKVGEVVPTVVLEEAPRPPRPNRVALEREAFQLMRQQLVPELVDIPVHKAKKIIRDRLYRLRKKLTQVESFKLQNNLNDVRPEFTLEEVARSDCRLPAFRDSIDAREVLLSEFAMRVRIKVLTSFYKAQKDAAPDLETDEYE